LEMFSRALLGSLRRGGRCAGRPALARVGGLARDCDEYGEHFTEQRVLERSTFCQCSADPGWMAIRIPHPAPRSPYPRRRGAASRAASSIFVIILYFLRLGAHVLLRFALAARGHDGVHAGDRIWCPREIQPIPTARGGRGRDRRDTGIGTVVRTEPRYARRISWLK